MSKVTVTASGTGESSGTTGNADSAGNVENIGKTLTQENLYNGDGQRIRKSEGAKETNYFYQDGVVSYTMEGSADTKAIQNLLGLEGNIIAAEERKENSASNETGSDSLTYHLYNKDIQGSTTSILNESGAGELPYEYDDFGETEVNGSGTFENEICYTGGIYDATTGLYYLNARYYDPENGRFLTEDTYRGEVKEPDTLHLYVYCANNPINYVDPSGHKFKVRRWMVAAPLDAFTIAIGLGTVYAPIKSLCKKMGKKLTTVSLKGKMWAFVRRFQKYARKIAEKTYFILKKIPIAKSKVKEKGKKMIVRWIEAIIYKIAGQQVIYKFLSIAIKNVDILLSIGGLTAGLMDYGYDKKLNNVLYVL